MSNDLYAIGFRFRGVGSDTAQSEGIVWGTGSAPSSSDYEWRTGGGQGRDLLVNPPSTIEAKTDPVTLSMLSPSAKPVLHRTKLVAETFNFQKIDPDAALASDLNDSDTDIDLDQSGLDNQVVQIGREAILLGSWDGDSYPSSTRGYWGTEATAHRENDNAYNHPPYWRGRLVDLVRYHESDGVSELETYYVTEIRESPDGTKLEIDLQQVFGALAGGELNREAERIDKDEHNFRYPSVLVDQSEMLGVKATRLGRASSTYKTNVLKVDSWDGTRSENVALQVGTALIVTPDTDFTQNAMLGSEFDRDFNDVNSISVKPGQLRLKDDSEVWELCVYGERIADYTDTFFARTGVQDPSPAQPLPARHRHHPLAISLIHLISSPETDVDQTANTYDLVQGQWTYDVAEFVDTSGVDSIMQQTAGYAIDQLILGWDGEPVNMWRIMKEKLWRPFQLYPGLDTHGNLQFSRFGLIGVEAYSDAAKNKVSALQTKSIKQRARRNALGSAVDTVTAKIDGLPWQDPASIVAREAGAPDRPAKLAPGEEWELDFSTIANSESGRALVNAIATSTAIKRHWALPRRTIRVHAPHVTGASYGIGDVIVVESLGVEFGTKHVVDDTGTFVEYDGDTIAQAGVVIARKHELETDTYELTILYNNFRAGELVRWRAPGMEVDSNNNGGNDDKLYCVASSQFGFDDSDNNSFFVDDDIQIINRDGAQVADGFTVSNIGSDGTGDFLQISGTFGQGDLSGTFVRLDDFDAYANTSILANVDDPWMWLADASETLGSNEDDGYPYGI